MSEEERGTVAEEGPIIETAGRNGAPVSVGDMAQLLNAFVTMMGNMEKRLSRQMDDNASASRDRWVRWETDFDKYRKATDENIRLLRADHDGLRKTVTDRFAQEEREELVWDARWSPLRRLVMWIGIHWKTILIVILGGAALLGFGVDAFHQLLGVQP